MRYIIFTIILLTSLLSSQIKVIIDIKGMTCPLCTSAIKKSLKNTKGVIKAKVYLNNNIAKVIYDDKIVNTKKLLKSIKDVGYTGKIKKGELK